MKANFNIYHFFAGAFVPFWLLSRQEIGSGAKMAYAMLAQQANSRGITQLNFQMQGVALGEPDGQLARYLMELEEVELIQVSRGNVHSEDIRIFFPLHQWMSGLEPITQSLTVPAPRTQSTAISPRLFPEDDMTAQAEQLSSSSITGLVSQQQQRDGRGKRRRRRPQSKHSYEVCLGFVTYQKEILHRNGIWSVTGLARHLNLSGEQDAEIDVWLVEQASSAA